VAKTELGNNANTPLKTEDSSSLKGTLASVFFVGFVMLATWASMYFVYLGRL
jgi:hypothetical protein